MTMAARNITGTATGSAPSTGAGVLADLPAPVTFSMPTPPSTNKLFRNVKGKGRVRTSAYDDWLMMAITAIRRQSIAPFPGRCVIIMGVERDSMLADIDNRIKAGWDAVVKAGVISDDSLITASAITWQPKANGLTRFEIRSVFDPLTLRFHPAKDGASGTWIVDAPPTEGEPDYGDLTI